MNPSCPIKVPRQSPPASASLEFTEAELQELLGYMQMKLKGQILLAKSPEEGMALILGANCGIVSFAWQHGEGKMLAIGSELNRRAPSGDYLKPAHKDESHDRPEN